MKVYFIKYDQPYSETNSDVFKKGCVEIDNKFLPVKLNWDEVIGKTKIYSDEVGCYIKKGSFDRLKRGLTKVLDIDLGFVVKDEEKKDEIRYIKKIKIYELSIIGEA